MSLLIDKLGEGRLIGYGRVSTRAQNIASQMNLLESLNCYPIFTDEGLSGSKRKRPGLEEMMNYLKAGDTLIIYSLSRLGRSVRNLAEIAHQLREKGVTLISVKDGLNTADSTGRLLFNILACIAEFQLDMIKENTIAGLEAARDAGKTLGRPLKLSSQQIYQIYEDITEGATLPELAKEYGVSLSTLKRGLGRLGEIQNASNLGKTLTQ